jgi:hypothetical protein
MKLLVYSSDDSAPIIFEDAVSVKHVLSNGEYRTMKVVSAQEVDRLAALESELAALRDPWHRIDPERPETLPPPDTEILLTVIVEQNYAPRNRREVISGYAEINPEWGNLFYDLLDNQVDAVAWQYLPAPYGDKTE